MFLILEEGGSDVPFCCPGTETIKCGLAERVIFNAVDNVVLDVGVELHVLVTLKYLCNKVAGFPLIEGASVL